MREKLTDILTAVATDTKLQSANQLIFIIPGEEVAIPPLRVEPIQPLRLATRQFQSGRQHQEDPEKGCKDQVTRPQRRVSSKVQSVCEHPTTLGPKPDYR